MKVRRKNSDRVYEVGVPTFILGLLTGRISLLKGGRQRSRQPLVGRRKPRRNKPCLCGSGVKFKRCCDLLPEEKQRRVAAAARHRGDSEWAI